MPSPRTRVVVIGASVAVVVSAVIVVLSVSTSTGGPGATAPGEPLRDLAAQVGLRIGTAVDTDLLGAEPQYDEIAASQFSTVTPENVMKWEVVEPQRGEYDYSAADELVAFAQEHDQLVRGHTLVWTNQLPAWLTDAAASLSADELRGILEEHVTNQVAHFKGDVWQWDVVNEPIDDDGSYVRNIWYTALGPDYIADAFRWAHEADPEALLFLNDYGIEYGGPKTDAMLDLATRLRADGVPIDGVGFETHLDIAFGKPDLLAAMTRFTEAGFDVAVTEADVRATLPVSEEQQDLQAELYASSLRACLQLERCLSYTVWGFDDQYSWIPGWFPGQGAAGIYDEFMPKPQYTALQRELEDAIGSMPTRREPSAHLG